MLMMQGEPKTAKSDEGSALESPERTSTNRVRSTDSVEVDEDDVSLTFPQRLMELLDEKSHSDIISWLPHGRGFVVFRKTAFEEQILPRYFHKQSKYSSFTRKLNRWGFVRVTRGPEAGAYYHPNFQRDGHRLCMQMSCRSSSSATKPPLKSSAVAVGSNNNIVMDSGNLLSNSNITNIFSNNGLHASSFLPGASVQSSTRNNDYYAKLYSSLVSSPVTTVNNNNNNIGVNNLNHLNLHNNNNNMSSSNPSVPMLSRSDFSPMASMASERAAMERIMQHKLQDQMSQLHREEVLAQQLLMSRQFHNQQQQQQQQSNSGISLPFGGFAGSMPSRNFNFNAVNSNNNNVSNNNNNNIGNNETLLYAQLLQQQQQQQQQAMALRGPANFTQQLALQQHLQTQLELDALQQRVNNSNGEVLHSSAADILTLQRSSADNKKLPPGNNR